MFKRINKRIRKKEKEEAAGLDDETIQVLGMHDTDSDESDSGSSSGHVSSRDMSDSDGEDEPAIQEYSGGKREVSEDSESSGSEDEGEDDTGGIAPMTVAEALSNPLYPVQTGSDAQACILCPGKELKHSRMVSVHVASSTHLRRMKRFATLAARVGDENEDPRLLVAALDDSVHITPREKAEKPAEPQTSKRDRRMAKRQRRRERRAAVSPAKKVDKELQAHSNAPGRNVPNRTAIQIKFARKRAESVKRHKLANPRKSGRPRKNARSKTASI